MAIGELSYIYTGCGILVGRENRMFVAVGAPLPQRVLAATQALSLLHLVSSLLQPLCQSFRLASAASRRRPFCCFKPVEKEVRRWREAP